MPMLYFSTQISCLTASSYPFASIDLFYSPRRIIHGWLAYLSYVLAPCGVTTPFSQRSDLQETVSCQKKKQGVCYLQAEDMSITCYHFFTNMQTPNKDRYYSCMGKSSEAQGNYKVVFFQMEQGGRVGVPPLPFVYNSSNIF